MGSQTRFDYSVLGDAVNLSARLEGQSKVYGVDIVVGEATQEQIDKSRSSLVQIDQLRVKGKQEPVRIFSPIAGAAGDDLRAHEAAMTAYHGEDFGLAKRLLNGMHGRFGSRLDQVYTLLLERRTIIENDTNLTWSGVWEAQEK